MLTHADETRPCSIRRCLSDCGTDSNMCPRSPSYNVASRLAKEYKAHIIIPWIVSLQATFQQ